MGLGEKETQMKSIVLATVLTAIAVPAFAAEFFIVQDTKSKKCTIVDQRPVTTTTVVVGDGKVFKTRAEAETAIKTVKVCTTN
jgi:hypothetical protein